MPCLVVLVLLAVPVCGGLFWFIFTDLRQTEPYHAALAAVRQDLTVVDRLGEPIVDGWLATGDVEIENDRGEAQLFFTVRGPRGSADVQARARRRGGVWRLVTVDVVFADGERHAVPVEPQEGEEVPEELEEAPLWEP